MPNTIQAVHLEISKLKNLPPLPEESVKILSAINNPDIDLDKLIKALSTSPIIVARLLGLANSAFFGYAGKVTNLRSAIKVLGLKLVKSISLSLLLNMSLDSTKCRNFDSQKFWQKAILTAVVAQNIAQIKEIPGVEPQTLYTAGLLLHIGLLTAVYIYPAEMDTLLLLETKGEGSLDELMPQFHGIDQYQLGAYLLDCWNLPVSYLNIIKNYPNSGYSEEHLPVIIVLRISSIIVNMIFDNTTEVSDENIQLLHSIDMSVDELQGIKTDILEKMDDVYSLVQVLV